MDAPRRSPNQSEDVFLAVSMFGPVDAEGVVGLTGWNRHVVDLVLSMMVDRGMAERLDRPDGEPRYRVVDVGDGR